MAKINSVFARGLLKLWKRCNPEQVRRFELQDKVNRQFNAGATMVEIRDGQAVPVPAHEQAAIRAKLNG